MSKDTSRKEERKKKRHDPLLVDIDRDKYVTLKNNRNNDEKDEDVEMGGEVIPPSVTRKLLREVKEQQIEMNEDNDNNMFNDNSSHPTINYLEDVSEEFTQDDDSYVEQIIAVDPQEEALMKLFMTDNNTKKNNS